MVIPTRIFATSPLGLGLVNGEGERDLLRGRVDVSRQQKQLNPSSPASLLPEIQPIIIVLKNEKMAFIDLGVLKPEQAVIDQTSTKTLPPVGWLNSQMMQIAPSPVVPAQDRAHNYLAIARYKT